MDGVTDAGHPQPDWCRDVTPASWIGPRLHPFGRDVGSVVPGGFEAYARLLHPVEPSDCAVADRRRWSDVAAANGRIVHAEMQFHLVSRPAGAPARHGYDRGTGPSWGSLPSPERRLLGEALSETTRTPDRCWFCVWEGFGGLDDRGIAARVDLPRRRYLLLGGALDMASADFDPPFDQSPNLWWPDDVAWVVATEIDLAWTYVGGTRRLVEALLMDGRLEVLEATLTDKVGYDTDLLNAALDAD